MFTYICNIYSTVGRSIADIYDPKHTAEIVCRGYGPPYCITYNRYYDEYAADEPFALL